MQDTVRHIPVKPVITDQPAKPPRQEAVYDKPPISLDHKGAPVLEHPAPILPPRPNLSGRPQNDLENLDPSMMNRANQSPKPLSRARTIGGVLEGAPPLPNRPTDIRASPSNRSSSVYKDQSSADSHNMGTSEGSQSDQSSPGLRRTHTIARTERLFVPKLYPDHSNANRSPPYIDGRPLTIHHRGPVKVYAMSDSNVVTGTHNTRVYNIYTGENTITMDHTASNDVSNRVCSMVFAPSLIFEDEGRYLWLGMQDGAVLVVDIVSGDIIGKRTDAHTCAVTTMLRYRNEEIWTIDDGGNMHAWPTVKGALAKGHSSHPLELHTRKDKVSGKLNLSLIAGNQLWMASGRVLDVYDVAHSTCASITNKAHLRMPNNVGDITQLATVPYHQGKVFVGHGDGQVTVWDADSVELVHPISLSIYGVSCMLAVGEFYLWAGYNTGMIYVYDTRPERWVVVKMWKAHSGQVVNMILDDSPLVKDKNLAQVASIDANGTIQVWDGLLSDNWRGKTSHIHVLLCPPVSTKI
jgi:WD40 repeat protein